MEWIDKQRLDLLLIDDSEEDYILTRRLLTKIEEFEFNLDWAATYETGLEKIANNRYDAYLVDYRLDKHDGLQFLREATTNGDSAPIILLTGQGERNIDLTAMGAGAADYLLKTEVTPPLLERSIRYAIERKRTEAALRENESRLRQIIDLVPHMIFAKDRHGRLLLVNQAVADAYHSTVEELTGTLHATVHTDPDEVEQMLAADLEVIASGKAKFIPQEHFVDAYGNHRILQTIKIPYVMSGVEGHAILGTAVDITERMQAEAALKKAHDELEQRVAERTTEIMKTNEILQEKIMELEQLKREMQGFLERRTRQVKTSTEIAQDIATTPNLEDLFRRVVNLIQKRFGYYHVHVYTLENDWLIMQEGTGEAGRKMKELSHRIPLGAKKSLVAQAAFTKEAVLAPDVYQDRYWLPNPLLSETQTEIATPIKLGDEVLGVLDVQNEMIGSLSHEDQLLLMGLCGQIAVAINNRRLEAEGQQAEEAQNKLIEDLDAFANTVGYNLRDPLELIIGYTHKLKEQARLPEELQEYLNATARNGHKMISIIDELQLLTGVRKEEVRVAPLNMARIVAEVQQRLAYLIQEYRAKITVSEYWPVVSGHKPWVEEVWANYLSNAIKYGGNPPHIQIGATAQSDGMARFWVRDNGPGLTHRQQSQLFTEFTQLKQVRMRGYGLGLSIVRRIITKLGGEVSVESDGTRGNGTTFSFTLPLQAKQ